MNRRSRSRFITGESAKWLAQGIISPEQKNQIDAIYAISRPHALNIQTIIFALAALLIGTGIVLFYAANWQSMHPMFKFVQIIIIITAFYAGGYYIAFKKNSLPAGMTLIRIGALAYAAGIGLTGQIFHLSAHPSGAFLLWALTSLVLGAIIKDGWITILSLAALTVWHLWQSLEFTQLNLLYFVLIAACAGVMVYLKMRRALVLIAIAFTIGYFSTISALFIKSGELTYTCNLFIFPFAALVLAAASLLKDSIFDQMRAVLGAGAIFLLYIPLIILSWPHEYFDSTFPLLANTSFAIAYYSVCALAISGAAILYFKKNISVLTLILYALPALVPLLPLGSMAADTAIMNAALLIFLAVTPLLTAKSAHKNLFELCIFLLLFATILIKSWGFVLAGFESEQYIIAYGCGVLIFLSIIFLLQISRGNTLKKKITLLTIVVTAFLTLYALSFTIDASQRGILQASPVVIPLLVTFLAAAVLLHLVLFAIVYKKELPLLQTLTRHLDHAALKQLRIPLYCSLMIFASALMLLFAANESLDSLVYSMTFNALLFIFTALLLLYAYAERSEAMANLAIAAFVIHLMTRYFDTFFDMSAGALLFIFTGLIALGGGLVVEKSRRRFLSQIKTMKDTNGTTEDPA